MDFHKRICRQTPVVEASLHYGAGKNLWFDKLTILSEIEGKLSAVRLTSTWFDCAHHESLSTSRRLFVRQLADSRGNFLHSRYCTQYFLVLRSVVAPAGGEMRCAP